MAEKIITKEQVDEIATLTNKTLELQEKQKKLLRDLAVSMFAQHLKQQNHGSLGTVYEWERNRDDFLHTTGFISEKEMKKIRFMRKFNLR